VPGSPWGNQVRGEEREGSDVAQVGGVELGFGGQVVESCAGVDGGGESEESGESEGG
jgi:hypothetical protein